jgi:hypothetical protein
MAAPKLSPLPARSWFAPSFTIVKWYTLPRGAPLDRAHVDAFSAIGRRAEGGGLRELKAGVTVACRYKPGINRTSRSFLPVAFPAARTPPWLETTKGVIVGTV